jgi:hypothetical protein
MMSIHKNLDISRAFKLKKKKNKHFISENKAIEDTVKPQSVSHDRFHTFHERNGHVKQLEQNVRP